MLSVEAKHRTLAPLSLARRTSVARGRDPAKMIWLTSASHRHRVKAVRRNPKVSVVVSGMGTSIGPGSACTIKGTCRVHEDDETRHWFFRAIAEHAFGIGHPRAEQLVEDLSTENRVVLEVVPEKYISYDDRKNQADREGTIDEGELAPYGEADAKYHPDA